MAVGFDFIVIGGGASGLTAAFYAAEGGKKVLLLDRMVSPAAKVLVSGGGNCNFSNKFVSADRYVSENPSFCKSALAGLSVFQVLEDFKSAGIAFEEREGGKFFAFSSARIRDFLISRASGAGVVFAFGSEISSVCKKDDCFQVDTDKGVFCSKSVLIATGGLSYPALGGGDFAFRTARFFGLNVVRPFPALVPMSYPAWLKNEWADLSGVSLPVRVSIGKKKIGDGLLFTHTGISGPAVLRASLYRKNGDPVSIDFLPDVSVFDFLKKAKNSKERKKTAYVLSELLPSRVAKKCIDVFLPAGKKDVFVTELSDKDITALHDGIKRFVFTPSDTPLWQKAEVTGGGVDTKELLSATLESRKIKGLFFAGEAVDVTGDLGGFNLHWAWASGMAVGKTVAANP